MLKNQITTNEAKKQGESVQAHLTGTVEMWINEFGYSKAELKPATTYSNGKIGTDRNEWTLWLDGEVSEITYGFFRVSESAIWFSEIHNW